MAQRDSARQEESIGTMLVSTGGLLTPKQQGFVGGGVGRPLKGVLEDFGAWGPAPCFLPPSLTKPFAPFYRFLDTGKNLPRKNPGLALP